MAAMSRRELSFGAGQELGPRIALLATRIAAHLPPAERSDDERSMLQRRAVLRMSAAALATSALARPGHTQPSPVQAWPSQPVTIVAPSAAGGSLDILARLFGRGLQERLGQP